MSGICEEYGIHFITAREMKLGIRCISSIIEFSVEKEMRNGCDYLGKICGLNNWSNKRVYWLIDGDRTLVPNDTTKLFLTEMEMSHAKSVFKIGGYQYESFRRMSFFYQNIANYNDRLSNFPANTINIYPEWIEILKKLEFENIAVIVVTSGIREVWEKIIIENGFQEYVAVFAGTFI